MGVRKVVVAIDDETGQAAADHWRNFEKRKSVTRPNPETELLDRFAEAVVEAWPPVPPPLQEGHLASDGYTSVRVLALGKRLALIEYEDGMEGSRTRETLTYAGPCPVGWGEQEPTPCPVCESEWSCIEHERHRGPSPGDPVTPDTPIGTKVVSPDGMHTVVTAHADGRWKCARPRPCWHGYDGLWCVAEEEVSR